MEAAKQAIRSISDEMLMQVMADARRLYAEAVKNGWAVDQQRLEWHYEIQTGEATRRGLI
jgi:hypothetical protein